MEAVRQGLGLCTQRARAMSPQGQVVETQASEGHSVRRKRQGAESHEVLSDLLVVCPCGHPFSQMSTTLQGPLLMSVAMSQPLLHRCLRVRDFCVTGP